MRGASAPGGRRRICVSPCSERDPHGLALDPLAVLDHGAVAPLVPREPVGLGLERFELPAELRHLRHLAVEVGDLAVQHAQHVFAGALVALTEAEDLGDLRERQVQPLGRADESETLDVVG